MVAEQRGRHRYHRLADARVAAVVEGLAALAPRLPVRSLRESDRTAAERAARSCYDHLAGALGAAMLTAMLAQGWVTQRPAGRALSLTPRGRDGLRRSLALEL